MGRPDAYTTYAARIRTTYRLPTADYREDQIVQRKEQEAGGATCPRACGHSIPVERRGRHAGGQVAAHPTEEHCTWTRKGRGKDAERWR